jgi:3-hydroxyethyl bacteriochlorophyllide a dehydrogenase
MHNLAIEYPAPGQVRFIDLGAPPDPGPMQVLIRTHYSGVTNGTERHALLGEHFWKGGFPSRHGYQHVGRIEKRGEAVKKFNEGDRVFFGQYVGHRGWHLVDVSCADPSSNGSHLVCPLPEDLDPVDCALLGVAGVAMRGVRRFRVAPAQRVWVAGQGMIGQFAAQSARALGARVTVSDVDEKRLEIAKACGAHCVINARDPGAWEAIKADGPYHCIIDACNLDSFLMDVYHRGLLAFGRPVVGMLAVHSEVTFYWPMLHGREASIEVSCHFSLDDLHVLLHFIRQDLIRIRPWISHFLPIGEALSIYETLRDKPADLRGVVFDWTR